MKRGYCHHCGQELEFVEKVFRDDTCPRCESDVRCCLNCVEYDESAPNSCREPQVEKVSVKDRRNFCEFFTLRETKVTAGRADKAAEARKKLETLFKK